MTKLLADLGEACSAYMDATMRDLTSYIYFRRNVAGVQREWWHHRQGCGTWFLAERDTRTNEVLKVERRS